MTDLWTYLKDAKKPVFLYGTGNGADKIADELIKNGITVTGVYASDGFVRDRYFRGYKVMSFSDVCRQYGDIISLVSFGTQIPEVMENIKKISEVCETYAPDVPVIADGEVFNAEYAKKHKSELEYAYSLLADSQSKKVFENIVKYKLTGKLDYLFDAETDKSEAYGLLGLKSAESYMDLGAYNGDTVKEFLNIVHTYRKIIAVEPDKKNFKKLTNTAGKLANTALYNAAVSDRDGKIEFAMRSGRNSVIGNGTVIDAYTVDTIASSDNITYIKMDIEGEEINAVHGAQKTLKRCKPKLNIAAYHKNADIFAIPILLKSIVPDYKIYLRHHPYIPAWDTNYYVK